MTAHWRIGELQEKVKDKSISLINSTLYASELMAYSISGAAYNRADLESLPESVMFFLYYIENMARDYKNPPRDANKGMLPFEVFTKSIVMDVLWYFSNGYYLSGYNVLLRNFLIELIALYEDKIRTDASREEISIIRTAIFDLLSFWDKKPIYKDGLREINIRIQEVFGTL